MTCYRIAYTWLRPHPGDGKKDNPTKARCIVRMSTAVMMKGQSTLSPRPGKSSSQLLAGHNTSQLVFPDPPLFNPPIIVNTGSSEL